MAWYITSTLDTILPDIAEDDILTMTASRCEARLRCDQSIRLASSISPDNGASLLPFLPLHFSDCADDALISRDYAKDALVGLTRRKPRQII